MSKTWFRCKTRRSCWLQLRVIKLCIKLYYPKVLHARFQLLQKSFPAHTAISVNRTSQWLRSIHWKDLSIFHLYYARSDFLMCLRQEAPTHTVCVCYAISELLENVTIKITRIRAQIHTHKILFERIFIHWIARDLRCCAIAYISRISSLPSPRRMDAIEFQSIALSLASDVQSHRNKTILLFSRCSAFYVYISGLDRLLTRIKKMKNSEIAHTMHKHRKKNSAQKHILQLRV